MGAERELTKGLMITVRHMKKVVRTMMIKQKSMSPVIVAATITMNAVQNVTARATTISITVNSGHAKVAANASVGQREAMT